ncbi:transporter substrate-binding domain-containing protein [Silvanigrella paludirubra]|uniref:Transporter substrate-binding domain-containing protein n=1 Tax=Silvanigrella paludirubra TaxID=2499159 RepID=A0A6N6VRK1_9BACT|nr:transporter substrate-binding domain-containing protein [Silvanigrella paludirubra]KAB8037638.1 transporter substrate-binding domain-containing protein [Silvanigrella paludirubra]
MNFIKLIIFILVNFIHFQIFAEKFIINTQDWPPYQTIANNIVGGSATKTLECVLKQMKLDYQINVLPWKRAQEDVKLGKAQAFYAAGITNERNDFAVPTEKIANYKWIWIFNKGENLDPTKKEFKKKALLAAKFGTGPETFLAENNYKLVASPKEIHNLFEMLQGKRFDAFLSPEEPALEFMKKNQMNKNNFKFIFHSNNPLVFYFSKKYVEKNQNSVKIFNSYLKNCNIAD